MTNKKPVTPPKQPKDDGKPDYRVLSLIDMSKGVRQEFRISSPAVNGSWQKMRVVLKSVKGLVDLSKVAFLMAVLRIEFLAEIFGLNQLHLANISQSRRSVKRRMLF